MHLSHHLHGLSLDYLISCFISGLRDLVKYEFTVKNHQSMRLAKLEDDNTSTRLIGKVNRKKVGFFLGYRGYTQLYRP